jgi:hypothetical protein
VRRDEFFRSSQVQRLFVSIIVYVVVNAGKRRRALVPEELPFSFGLIGLPLAACPNLKP